MRAVGLWNDHKYHDCFVTFSSLWPSAHNKDWNDSPFSDRDVTWPHVNTTEPERSGVFVFDTNGMLYSPKKKKTCLFTMRVPTNKRHCLYRWLCKIIQKQQQQQRTCLKYSPNICERRQKKPRPRGIEANCPCLVRAVSLETKHLISLLSLFVLENLTKRKRDIWYIHLVRKVRATSSRGKGENDSNLSTAPFWVSALK